MNRSLKQNLRKIPFINYLANRVNRYRASRPYHWMTKQMHLVDPAQDIRSKYWLKCGVKSTGNFRVGYGVYFDAGNANRIHIEDGVWIASECLLLCHRRIIDDYHVGDDYNKLSFKVEDIYLKRGCCIGMRSIIMPGVTVGEGAIVGVGSLVTKDVPPYSVAVGRPAKIVRYFKNADGKDQIIV